VFSVAQIAEYLQGQIIGDAELEIVRLSPLVSADTGCVSFCAHTKSQQDLRCCNASVVLVQEIDKHLVKHTAIVVADPYLAFAKISQWFDWRAAIRPGMAENAVIAESATVSEQAQVCSFAVIGENVDIGAGCYIGANTVIGDDCSISANSRIEANVTLYANVHLGERCIVHSSAVLGADGFGFAKSASGWQKIYQLGGVRIGNDVEIGASTTVDRGALCDTVIGDGVKLDNQVQIAHNVRLGKHTAIAGCTAIAGSTHIGDNCTIAGLSGVTGHLQIAADTHITAMSLVSHSIKKAGIYSSGTAIEPHPSWKRNVVRFRSLDQMAKRLKNLENEMQQLAQKVKKDDGY